MSGTAGVRKRRAPCRYCGREVAVTRHGYLHQHNSAPGVVCDGSRTDPQTYRTAQ